MVLPRTRWLLPSIVLVGVALMLYLLISLGFWQLQRGAEKAAIKADYEARVDRDPVALEGAMLDPERFEFYPVDVLGEYVPEHQILVDNRIRNGRPGYGVITPFRLSGSNMHVLVDRGWIPWNPDRSVLPDVPTPAGRQRVTGILKLPARDFYTLEGSRPGSDQRVWQNLDMDHYRQLKDFELQELIILLSPESPAGGFERDLPNYPDQWIARHRGYALQWFGLALVLVIACSILVLRSRRGADDE